MSALTSVAFRDPCTSVILLLAVSVGFTFLYGKSPGNILHLVLLICFTGNLFSSLKVQSLQVLCTVSSYSFWCLYYCYRSFCLGWCGRRKNGCSLFKLVLIHPFHTSLSLENPTRFPVFLSFRSCPLILNFSQNIHKTFLV